MKNVKRRLFVFSMLFVLGMTLASAGVKLNYAQFAVVYLDGPTVTSVDKDFTVSVKVADVVKLWGWQVKLQWDPTMIAIVDVVEGDFLKAGGTTVTQVLEFLDPHPPVEWLLSGVYLENPASYADGSGTLVNVTFHCTGTGISSLDLLQTRLFSSPVTIPWNGYGDVDGDGTIEVFDAVAVSEAYGTSIGESGYNAQADFDSDGFVDLYDMLGPALNLGRQSPDPELVPVDIGHSTIGTTIDQIPTFPVTWRWWNITSGDYVYYTEYLDFEGEVKPENFSYAQPLDYVSFNITSTGAGYCNVTIPKLFMSGAFEVLMDETPAPSVLSWSRTRTSVYFTYIGGLHNVRIRGEIATRIHGLWNLSDANGDGVVDIIDIVIVAGYYGWREQAPP